MIAYATPADFAAEAWLGELVEHGLLIPSGVPGVHGLSGVFEQVVEGVDRHLTRSAAPLGAEVMRFPPLLSRRAYELTGHLSLFPNLMGSVHTFAGAPQDVAALAQKQADGEDWSTGLTPTAVMLTPAARARFNTRIRLSP